MNKKIHSITGLELIELLEKNGWKNKRHAKHGKSLAKYIKKIGKTIVAVIPTKSESLPKSTLGRILSIKQTRLRREGLLKLIKKYSK